MPRRLLSRTAALVYVLIAGLCLAGVSAAAGNPGKQGYESSEASGNPKTLITGSNPSLYIRNLINVNFLSPGGSGQIGIYPAAGQRINGPSQCEVATTKPYGIGVHCDLYSNRF